MNSDKNFENYLNLAWQKYSCELDRQAKELDQLYSEYQLSEGTESELATLHNLLNHKRLFEKTVGEFCDLIYERSGQCEDDLMKLYSRLHESIRFAENEAILLTTRG